MKGILFVCPTYDEAGLHAYTRRSVLSFLKYTPDGDVLVVDDASPGWEPYSRDLAAIDPARVATAHFEEWGGLTRSWNWGLASARELGYRYALCGNNDVAFTRRWSEAMASAVENGFSLAGPVSNAPGITSAGLADVRRYAPGCRVDDSPEYLNGVADGLAGRYAGVFVEAPVNGFCLFAKTEDWWSGAFDERHVFRPRNDFNSKGAPNSTPLMTCNEDELQGRWSRAGRRSAVCPGSFVFHYRSVARGKKFAKSGWLRVDAPDRAA